MPGYVIHLAVGKIYSQNNRIQDLISFEKGIIEPDLLPNKEKSHFGPFSSQPGLDTFIQEKGVTTSFNEGYFLHLVTDYLFYNKFLKEWSSSIYQDYNILNGIIMKKYGVVLPDSVKEKVKFNNGKLSILDFDSMSEFIETVGKLDIRNIVLKSKNNLKEKIGEELDLV